MTTKDIEMLFLNIGDIFTVKLSNYYYKITEQPHGDQTWKFLEEGFNKEGQEGWIHCPTLTGKYCGCRWKQNTNELKVIKIRPTKPYKMSQNCYLEFQPEEIMSILADKKGGGNIIDKICHTLTMEEHFDKN